MEWIFCIRSTCRDFERHSQIGASTRNNSYLNSTTLLSFCLDGIWIFQFSQLSDSDNLAASPCDWRVFIGLLKFRSFSSRHFLLSSRHFSVHAQVRPEGSLPSLQGNGCSNQTFLLDLDSPCPKHCLALPVSCVIASLLLLFVALDSCLLVTKLKERKISEVILWNLRTILPFLFPHCLLPVKSSDASLFFSK